ncbi:MAG: hypothetical protein J5950_02605, partial [Clostridia bacterium]|nr:hypothetical protein [Clostridia bacterium]
MKEEFFVNEENQRIQEFHAYSEFNAESRIGETEQYATEGEYLQPEFQEYDNGASANRLSRHSSVLRKNRNRLGRLLAMLAAVAGPVIVALLYFANTILVDVRGYHSEPDSLKVVLSLYSSFENTKFDAVLSDSEGNVVETVENIDRNRPELRFSELTPGEIYYLEVFADGESKLKLNYLLPDAEKEMPETPTPSPADDTPGPGTFIPVTSAPTSAPTTGPITAPTAEPTAGPTAEPTTEPTTEPATPTATP